MGYAFILWLLLVILFFAMRLIVFVCSSNRSRSPLAASYFSWLIQSRGISDITVSSAGLSVRHGTTLSHETRQVLTSNGLTALAVGTVPLLPKLVRTADLLICMTSHQQEQIEAKFPSARGKCRPLMSVLESSRPVIEPDKGSVASHQHCLDEMKPALEALLDLVE